jgi:sigma-E factor negative regulatory protein RseB
VQAAAIKPAFLAVVLLLAAGSGACADPIRQDALNWLQTMAFAAHQTDYSGTFVYQYGDHVETSRITHIADRDGEHGRLESLDGPRREIIRHNDQVWCDMGDGKMKMEQRQGGREFPALLPEQITLLNENYLIKPAEEVRLAGFHAHAIVFQPKDNLRYTHKMWADSVSGLLLKSEVLDERGGVIEQYSFTQLSIGGDIDRKWITASQTAVGSPAHHIHKQPQADKPLQADGSPYDGDAHFAHNFSKMAASPITSGWRVDALPAGFRKIAEVRRQLHGRDAPVIQMVFSDGLAGISVFIEQSDHDEDDHSGLSSQGVIQIYSKLLNDQLITVVGEVPPRTVMQVADSVRNGGSQ